MPKLLVLYLGGCINLVKITYPNSIVHLRSAFYSSTNDNFSGGTDPEFELANQNLEVIECDHIINSKPIDLFKLPKLKIFKLNTALLDSFEPMKGFITKLTNQKQIRRRDDLQIYIDDLKIKSLDQLNFVRLYR